MVYIKLTNSNSGKDGFYSVFAIQAVDAPASVENAPEGANSVVTFVQAGVLSHGVFEEEPDQIIATIKEALSQSDATLTATTQLAVAVGNTIAQNKEEDIDVKLNVNLPSHG